MPKIYIDPQDTKEFLNGAVGTAPFGKTNKEKLGHLFKVTNCPVRGTNLKRTCYATRPGVKQGEVLAIFWINERRITGKFSLTEEGVEFILDEKYRKEFVTQSKELA